MVVCLNVDRSGSSFPGSRTEVFSPEVLFPSQLPAEMINGDGCRDPHGACLRISPRSIGVAGRAARSGNASGTNDERARAKATPAGSPLAGVVGAGEDAAEVPRSMALIYRLAGGWWRGCRRGRRRRASCGGL